jgi:hypothetical protein
LKEIPMSLLLCLLLAPAADEAPVEPGPTYPKTTAADRVRSINNLKQIGLAFHNFHDAMGAMPAAAAYGDAKKPLLSWRVALLPYLEEGDLYKEFKLDEAWDSPHNKKLIGKMPKVYAPPADAKSVKPGHTYYQVFTGANALFNPAAAGGGKFRTGPRLTTIPDGTTYTILAVEAGDPVPWTKPDDIVYDAKKPVPRLGGLFKEAFHVAMADGAVRKVGRKVKEATLRALITPNGGERIDWEKDVPGPDKGK